MTHLLEVHDLYKIHAGTADEQPVLRGVDFAVDSGEFIAVMGPSGSGKTTLLHLLSGLDEPSAGSVLLDGVDLAKSPEAQRTRVRRDRVGYVFQFFHLMPNLTVRENIGLPIAIAGQNPDRERTRIDELGERLAISPRMDAYPHELSGGEMQRASIARALVGGQPLLLCDEPTGNLAQAAGREVMELLRRACDDDGRTVVVVTHNPRDAAFADRVLFLVDGEMPADHQLTAGVDGARIAESDVSDALARLAI